MRKLSSLTQPSGRLARSTRLFSIGRASLTGTALAGEQARRPRDDQHLAASLRLEAAIDSDQTDLAARKVFLEPLGRTRLAERPGEAGAAFAERDAIVGADHAERTAQDRKSVV